MWMSLGAPIAVKRVDGPIPRAASCASAFATHSANSARAYTNIPGAPVEPEVANTWNSPR
jgi:hypothetical protein